MQERDNRDPEVDNYIDKNIEYSLMLTDFLEMITLLLKEGTNTEISKVEPEDLSAETDKSVYGIELNLSLLLSHEGYGQSEIFLFKDEENRDKFYLYLDNIINN